MQAARQAHNMNRIQAAYPVPHAHLGKSATEGGSRGAQPLVQMPVRNQVHILSREHKREGDGRPMKASGGHAAADAARAQAALRAPRRPGTITQPANPAHLQQVGGRDPKAAAARHQLLAYCAAQKLALNW